jgi:hypothetical protein
MGLDGVSRLKAAMASVDMGELKRHKDSHADRDAHGHSGFQKHDKPKILSPEQEIAALEKLNQRLRLAGAGLSSHVVRVVGKAPHVEIRNSQGAVTRHVAYEQLIEVYLERNNDQATGSIIRRAA